MIVQNANHDELRRTAYRLGITPAQVLEGRRSLKKATSLIEQVAGQQSVGSLAMGWIRLERSQAESAIRSILATLRKLAEKAEERSAYERITEDAGNILLSLRVMGIETEGHLPQDWPEPPVGEGAGPAPLNVQKPSSAQMFRFQHFHTLASENPQSALEMLPELEQGRPSAALRGSLLWNLAQHGGLEQADRLLDEVLFLLAEQVPEERTNMEMLLFYAGQFSPERLAVLIPLWAENVATTYSNVEMAENAPPDVPMTRYEYQMLSSLAQMNRFAGGGIEDALAALPELKRKADQLGGLGKFQRHLLQEQQSMQAQFGGSSRRFHPDLEPSNADQDLMQMIQASLNAARQSLSKESYEETLQSLEFTSKLISQLKSPRQRLQTFRQLIENHLRLDGRVSSALLERGWDLLDQLDDEPLEGDSPSYFADPGEFEVWLLAAWAWSDYDAASKHLAKTDEATSFAACQKLVQWLTTRDSISTRGFH